MAKGRRSSSSYRQGREAAPSSSAQYRDWRHLPASALLCVCHHLPDLATFFGFAGTCREWRDVAGFCKRAFMASHPPLLCTVDGQHFYSPVNAKCYKNHRVAAAVRRMKGTVIDVSQGYLVIEADCFPKEKKVVLVNPFTNHWTRRLPPLKADFVDWVVLTAPPTSPDCVVVVWSSVRLPTWYFGSSWMEVVEYTRPGDAQWTRLEWGTDLVGTPKPVASADGKVYAWAAADGDLLDLVVMEFPRGEEPHEVTRLRAVYFTHSYVYPVPCLVDPGRPGRRCDQQLLLVRASFASSPGAGGSEDVKNGRFEIYRVVASSEEVGGGGRLVRNSDGLGGRALVMDFRSCRVASNPAGWGGRGDDVYFSVGHGPEAWRLRLTDAGRATASHHYAPWPNADQMPYGVVWLLPADCYV